MHNYGDPQYWEKRYKEQENTTFDWLEDYESLKPLIAERLAKDSKILMLGCGNAECSEKMYDDGYENVDNIDISEVCIKQMRARNTARKHMTYEVMDVRSLKYPDGKYDMAIDKSTIDALLCGESAFSNVAVMIKEVQRVLRPGGYYVVISYGKPENRLPHLQREHLAFDIQQFTISEEGEGTEEDKCHYIYVCKKKPEADAICKAKWPTVEAGLKRAEQDEELDEEAGDEDEGEDDPAEAPAPKEDKGS